MLHLVVMRLGDVILRVLESVLVCCGSPRKRVGMLKASVECLNAGSMTCGECFPRR